MATFEHGHEKQGGRKKGTPNKATAAKAAEIAASGLSPLDYMLSLLRDGNKPESVRLDAAKSAAPYVHPRLAAIDVNFANMTDDELRDSIGDQEATPAVPEEGTGEAAADSEGDQGEGTWPDV